MESKVRILNKKKTSSRASAFRATNRASVGGDGGGSGKFGIMSQSLLYVALFRYFRSALSLNSSGDDDHLRFTYRRVEPAC